MRDCEPHDDRWLFNATTTGSIFAGLIFQTSSWYPSRCDTIDDTTCTENQQKLEKSRKRCDIWTCENSHCYWRTFRIQLPHRAISPGTASILLSLAGVSTWCRRSGTGDDAVISSVTPKWNEHEVTKKPIWNSEIFHANSEKSKRFYRKSEKSSCLFC